MHMTRLMGRALPAVAAVAALAAVAPVAGAQGQPLFQWTGRVDREIQLVMRGNRVTTNLIGENEPGRGRVRVMSGMPAGSGTVQVQMLEGRGQAYVAQQPTPQNGYTTVIDITDPQGGAGEYRIAAYWQNYANGEYVGPGRARRDRDRYCDPNDPNCGQAVSGQYYPNGQPVYSNGQPVYSPNGRPVYTNGQYGSRTLLHWSGAVDGDLEIRIGQNGQVSYRVLNGQSPNSVRADRAAGMVPAGASVSIVRNQGRGDIRVVQQPSQWNGYTTVVRVHDPQSGYGYYDFNVVW